MKRILLLLSILLSSLSAQTAHTFTIVPNAGTVGSRTVGTLSFQDKQTAFHTVSFKAADTIAANLTFVWPDADGIANSCIRTNGSGVLSFGTCGAGGLPSVNTVVAGGNTYPFGGVTESLALFELGFNISSFGAPYSPGAGGLIRFSDNATDSPISFYVRPSGSGTTSKVAAFNGSGNFVPALTDTFDLGADPSIGGAEWNNLYVKNVVVSGTISGGAFNCIGGTPPCVAIGLNTYVGAGAMTLGSANAKNVEVYANNTLRYRIDQSTGDHSFFGNTLPGATTTYSSGSSSARWNGVWTNTANASGVITTGSDILPTGDGVTNIGTYSIRAGQIHTSILAAWSLQLLNNTAGATTGWTITPVVGAGTGDIYLDVKDDLSNPFLRMYSRKATARGGWTELASSLYPTLNGSYPLGLQGNAWSEVQVTGGVYAYNALGPGHFQGGNSRGTVNSPTATLTGDDVISLQGVAYTGSGWTNPTSTITFRAADNIGVSAQGSYITFNTTKALDVATNITNRATITSDSNGYAVFTLGNIGAASFGGFRWNAGTSQLEFSNTPGSLGSYQPIGGGSCGSTSTTCVALGGNTYAGTGNMKVGTLNAKALDFLTNSIARVSIDNATGNVTVLNSLDMNNQVRDDSIRLFSSSYTIGIRSETWLAQSHHQFRLESTLSGGLPNAFEVGTPGSSGNSNLFSVNNSGILYSPGGYFTSGQINFNSQVRDDTIQLCCAAADYTIGVRAGTWYGHSLQRFVFNSDESLTGSYVNVFEVAHTAVNLFTVSNSGVSTSNTFKSTFYTHVGQSFGNPGPMVGDTIVSGAMYYDTSTGKLMGRENGSWVSLTGVASLTSPNAVTTTGPGVTLLNGTDIGIIGSGNNITISSTGPHLSTANSWTNTNFFSGSIQIGQSGSQGNVNVVNNSGQVFQMIGSTLPGHGSVTVTGDIFPNVAASYNSGLATLYWNTVYASNFCYSGTSPCDRAGFGAPGGGCGTGSIYRRTDGGAGTTLYVCESGGWVAK
jgi:hypothetical protein